MDNLLLGGCLAFIIFVAAFIRTLTGFGFALLAVPAMGLLLSPVDAVGLSLIFQIISGLPLALKGREAGEVKYAFKLASFTLLGLVPGLLVLLLLQPMVARLMLIASLLVSLFIITRGYRFAALPTLKDWLVVGLTAGFMQGVAAAPGPPVLAALHADSSLNRYAKRRVLAVFFTLTGTLSLPWVLMRMPDELKSLPLLGMLLLAMFLGIWLGERCFTRVSDRNFRQATVLLLWVALGLALQPLLGQLI